MGLDYLSWPDILIMAFGPVRLPGNRIKTVDDAVECFLENREGFEVMRLPTVVGNLFAHRPGERKFWWWFAGGFPKHGPRLLVVSEQAEHHIHNQRFNRYVPSHSFSDGSEELISRWHHGDMPTEHQLREHNSFCPPSRDFCDGYESSVDFLERHNLFSDDETELLNERMIAL